METSKGGHHAVPAFCCQKLRIDRIVNKAIIIMDIPQSRRAILVACTQITPVLYFLGPKNLSPFKCII